MSAEFCAEELWNLNLTWFSDSPDFTPCFNKTVLVYLPCAFLWIFSPIEIRSNFVSKNRFIPWSWLNICKIVSTGLLCVLSLLELVRFSLLEKDELNEVEIVGADFASSSVKLATFLFSILLVFLAKRAGRVTSGIHFLFWTLMSVCQGITFGSVVNHDKVDLSSSTASDVIYIVSYVLIIFNFCLHCFADKSPEYVDIKVQTSNHSPELKSSFISRLLFSWFDKTVWNGRKKTIDHSDLWDLNPEDSIQTIIPNWDRLWKEAQTKSGSEPANVLKVLVQAFGTTFLTGGLWQLAYVLLQFVSPLILNLIITFVQGDDPIWRGYLYTVILSVAALVAAMADSQYWYKLNLVGLRLKTALSTAIYKKSLNLSNSSRREKTAGEIVNLINVDCQKLIDACMFVNMMWSCPLQVGLSIFFLYQTIGVAVFVGLGVLLILFPVNGMIWAIMEKYQHSQMLKKDQRVRLISEILSGIKVLKLYAWELSFIKRINSLRDEEVYQLRLFQFLEGTQYFVWSTAPLLVALASFVTYVLIDPVNNILDSQTAFVSLTLFNTMRGPLFLLPFGIVSLIQGAVSIRRINSFLNSEDLDVKSVSHSEDSVHPVSLRHASFKWSKNASEPTTLRSLSWHVPEGALVAVVGTVGSGKSSLLSALLGEMIRMEGEANVRGKVAYVPQQAWMRNTSLKENILFGKKLKDDVYDKVIDACALKPDLDILTGGDQTEIGEKGINLSGGQKQRVSLARAVYNNADLYLLDDPLSAVDSHVGKHIFEKVIGPKGALRKKTRILVTHGIGYLPLMDQIVVLKDGKISEIGTYEELMGNRGAFAEFLIEQLQGQESDSSMSESERDDIRLKLQESLGAQSLKTKLEGARKARKHNTNRRVKTTSIGSMGDYLSESESIFSLANTDIGSGRPHRRKSQALGMGMTSRQTSIAQSDKDADKVKGERGSGVFKVGRDLIEDETAETDRVKLEIYIYYAKAIGVGLTLASVALYACFQFFNIFGNFWLSIWAEDQEAGTNIPLRNKYMAVYGILGLLQACSVLIAVIVVTIGTLRASVKLHKEMLEHILTSTMAFFDTTPIGRIINRFSKDIDEVDLMIPTHIKDILTDFFSVIGTLFVVCYASPIIIAVVVPLIFIFFIIQNSYLAVSRQLKRMVSVSRSPINSSLTESYSGAPTIRAFRMEDAFIQENAERVEVNQKCYYPEVASNSWLFSRLEMLANLLIIFTSLFAVIYRDSMDPGLVGLSLTYTFTFQLDIFLMTRYVAELEKSIVSVERIREYQHTPVEAPFYIPENDPPSTWPENGVIEFDNYATRYREGLDLVLRGVSFKVQPTEKVGIVGRTGAGKSSLTLSLFRIIEGASGCIKIDDINIAQMGLQALRSALTIIPQDPVLFSGSMRFNLDPFCKYSDPDLWRTLEHAHLRQFVSQLPDGLDYEVSEGGENLSVGQRQLVCLARALLRKTKVLVLDEATAAVDLETDDLIQATIRQEFSDCTVLTIAHRLKTIMDSDKILVLDAGMVKEFDSPENLLDNPNSSFYSMAKDAGLVS